MTSASGRGSGGTSDQGRVSVHMDRVSGSAVGISASKVSAPCHSIKCHAGAYSNYTMLHTCDLYVISFGPLVGYVSWLFWVSMTESTCLCLRMFCVFGVNPRMKFTVYLSVQILIVTSRYGDLVKLED